MSASSTISVTGDVCGQSASSVVYTGQASAGAASVSPGNLDYSLVPCGQQGTSQQITITNNAAGSFDWTANLGGGLGSPYQINPQSGTVAGNSTATITVTPNAIPGFLNSLPQAFNDTVTVTTDIAGDTPHQVTLTEGAEGAILSFNPTAINFPDTALPNSSSSPFSVINNGNMNANVTLTIDPGAGVPWPSATPVRPACPAPTRPPRTRARMNP